MRALAGSSRDARAGAGRGRRLSQDCRGRPLQHPHGRLPCAPESGLTLEQAVAKSLRDGIQYGIAVNCGKGFPTETDDAAREFIDSLQRQPVFVAMQAEGREWTRMFSRQPVEQFDYVFTDSMTWTDNRGRRMRTWIPEEVGAIPDPQEFMDTLVDRAVGSWRPSRQYLRQPDFPAGRASPKITRRCGRTRGGRR